IVNQKGAPVVTPASQFQSTKVRLAPATAVQQHAHQAQVQQARTIVQNRQKLETVVVNNTGPRVSPVNTSTTVSRSTLVGNHVNMAPRIQTPSTKAGPLNNVQRGPQIVTPTAP